MVQRQAPLLQQCLRRPGRRRSRTEFSGSRTGVGEWQINPESDWDRWSIPYEGDGLLLNPMIPFTQPPTLTVNQLACDGQVYVVQGDGVDHPTAKAGTLVDLSTIPQKLQSRLTYTLPSGNSGATETRTFQVCMSRSTIDTDGDGLPDDVDLDPVRAASLTELGIPGGPGFAVRPARVPGASAGKRGLPQCPGSPTRIVIENRFDSGDSGGQRRLLPQYGTPFSLADAERKSSMSLPAPVRRLRRRRRDSDRLDALHGSPATTMIRSATPSLAERSSRSAKGRSSPARSPMFRVRSGLRPADPLRGAPTPARLARASSASTPMSATGSVRTERSSSRAGAAMGSLQTGALTFALNTLGFDFEYGSAG